ncbi:hypothetical protein ACM39_02475 [Chryseobacterium sp. FH2]|uniref:hypothetical protein n=1 Tax=Chryseobacterium sp. FH2 TaxID=1674291 RepID=UPI00065AF5C6|nr:hypothetical protein [Chryseobacterium sp. FH2]KMQ69925.1 hypothetical protein ACM39_02475 [Chryseobacterium sp. FH2]
MITKEKAFEIAEQYINERKRNYLRISPIEKVYLEKEKRVPYPFSKYYEQIKNMYVVAYDVEKGYDEIPHFVSVDAETGEVLFTMTEHGYAEDWED